MTLEATAPPDLPRVYPHVDDITDWRAQQTIRLLWDRVFALEGRLQGVEATQGDLVSSTNRHNDQLTRVDHKADEALALRQTTIEEKVDVLVQPKPIATVGRFWMNGAMVYRPRFISGFRLPSLAVVNNLAMRNYLDMALSLGFNGVRVLAGDLSWAPQTAAEARQGLPAVLKEAFDRSMAVEVTALSDTAPWTSAQLTGHVDAIGQICAKYDNVLCEVANEPWHGSQSPIVHDFTALSTWGQNYFGSRQLAWACGAPFTDQPTPATDPMSGRYVTIHLDRGGDLWHMVRRVRELDSVSAAYGHPAMNNEPIGWGEVEEPGRRTTNDNIAFTMGCLSRGFELGLVSHADHGLLCTMPGPIQTACHQAAVAGFNVFGVNTRLRFEDIGWANSPIGSAAIEAGVVNVYSFMDEPTHGWSVLVGLTGNPGISFQNGFNKVRTVVARTGVEVWEVSTSGQLPLIAPNMEGEVAQTMLDHPEIDTLNEDERGKIIDITDWRVNGGNDRPWGRKARFNNPGNPQLNSDGMTYLRPDGLFEIYDCISGVTGEATWDGTGPFQQGENGYWWPPQPI